LGLSALRPHCPSRLIRIRGGRRASGPPQQAADEVDLHFQQFAHQNTKSILRAAVDV
jgi:hypothetical protein